MDTIINFFEKQKSRSPYVENGLLMAQVCPVPFLKNKKAGTSVALCHKNPG